MEKNHALFIIEIMFNEMIFFLHTILISLITLVSLRYGKSALISLICLLCVLANLFVTKQIILFGYSATPSDALMVGAVCALNLLQEFYGKRSAQQAIWLSFSGMIVYTLLAQFQCAYLPSHFDHMNHHFFALLHLMPRLAIASLISYLTSQQADRWLFGLLQLVLPRNYFILRNALSVATTQLLDTILFTFLGLYGTVHSVVDIITISYIIKLVTILLATPFLLCAQSLYQTTDRHEQTI